MAEPQSSQKLTILIPNGIILALIGALVMITPLAVEVHGSQLIMDLVAGGILLAGGGLSLCVGIRRARRPATDDSLEPRT